MADVHSEPVRSYNMSRIRGKDTKPEMVVRRFLHGQGFRYRLHGGKAKKGKPAAAKALAGKPDIVLPKYKTVIFIHGCFWHGHARCKYFKIPATRTEWWTHKINTNKANDAKAVKWLKKEGWKVVVVWECALKKEKAERTLASIAAGIRQAAPKD